MRKRGWRGGSSAEWVSCVLLMSTILLLSCGAEESVRSTAAVAKPTIRYGGLTAPPPPEEITDPTAE